MQNKNISEFAIASLIVGIISFVQLLAIEKAFLAIGLGLFALNKMAKNPDLQGKKLAIAGIILGIIYLFLLSSIVAANPDIFLKVRNALGQ